MAPKQKNTPVTQACAAQHSTAQDNEAQAAGIVTGCACDSASGKHAVARKLGNQCRALCGPNLRKQTKPTLGKHNIQTLTK
jgi:hypothetical protein